MYLYLSGLSNISSPMGTNSFQARWETENLVVEFCNSLPPADLEPREGVGCSFFSLVTGISGTILKTQSILNNCDLILRFLKHGWAGTQLCHWPPFARSLSRLCTWLCLGNRTGWSRSYPEWKMCSPFQPHVDKDLVSGNTEGNKSPDLVLFWPPFLKTGEVVGSKKRWMISPWTILRAQ